MSESTWTWVLFGAELVGMAGMLAVGRRHWWGWIVVLVHSVPWFIYAIGHDRPGFVAMSGLWWTVNGLNARRWFRHDLTRASHL